MALNPNYQLDELDYQPYYDDGHLFNVAEGLSYEDFVTHLEDENFDREFIFLFF